MGGDFIDAGVLSVIAIVGGGWIFLVAAGENVSRWIRNRRQP